MRNTHSFLCVFSAYLSLVTFAAEISSVPTEACLKVAGQPWVSPQEVRECMSSIPFTTTIRDNVLQVINRTLPFHVSTTYQLQAPKPYDQDVHWDLLKGLEDIKSRQYESDFDFHLDVRQSLKRVNDGHLAYANWCYDSIYITYNPFPLVLLTDMVKGSQDVHIAPLAHEIASSILGDEVKFWEDALGRPLKEFSGARVIHINGNDPFFTVNANAQVTGSFQGLSSRQNAFFSTSVRGKDDWNYVLGDFAQIVHPTVDSVQLTIKRVGSDSEETITVPYRSKFNREEHFTNLDDYKSKFCTPTNTTNGHDVYSLSVKVRPSITHREVFEPADIVLPQALQPDLEPLPGVSYTNTQFYILKDKTGVLVMGTFDGDEVDKLTCRLLQGLQKMRELGVENLIIDVTNNPGGYVCVAQFLHRLLFGQTNATYPQPGLDTTIRVTPIAQKIVKKMRGRDPDNWVFLNRPWTNATNQPIDLDDDEWFTPIKTIINGRPDAFSQRFGKECKDPSTLCKSKRAKLDPKPLFKAENVVVLSNGRCGSSCALFSVLLAKKHAVRTVVVGGKLDVSQNYCGFVGGESLTFVDVDTALLTTGLKKENPPYPEDIPPPFIVNAAMTFTFRLAYGVYDSSKPEEWQEHTASVNFPLTAETANKPQAIWEAVSAKEFPLTPPVLRAQACESTISYF